jgi:hypothetical protein
MEGTQETGGRGGTKTRNEKERGKRNVHAGRRSVLCRKQQRDHSTNVR